MSDITQATVNQKLSETLDTANRVFALYDGAYAQIDAKKSDSINALDARKVELLTDMDITGRQRGWKNLLINGDFNISQRGYDKAAFTGDAADKVLFDMWRHQYCDHTVSVSRPESGVLGNNTIARALRIIKQDGEHETCETTQKIETETTRMLVGQPLTFSFYARKVGTTFGTHALNFGLGSSKNHDDRGWVNPHVWDLGRATRDTEVLMDNAWRRYSVTYTPTLDAITLYATIYSSGVPMGEGIDIAMAQLEVGSVATPFEQRPVAVELSMCKRYFERIEGFGAPNGGKLFATGAAQPFSSHEADFAMPMTEKRVIPSVSVPSSNKFTVQCRSQEQEPTALNFLHTTPDVLMVRATFPSAYENGDAVCLYTDPSRNGYFDISAEF